jgi:hypothetical protein
MVNRHLLSGAQESYVLGILDLIMEAQSPGVVVKEHYIIFPMFCVLAALSERIVALESTVANCLDKMDMTALKTKLTKARDMFLVNDHTHKVWRSMPHHSLLPQPSPPRGRKKKNRYRHSERL